MENQNKEISFARMLAGIMEMFIGEMNLEVTECKPHSSRTLKVIALPEKSNTVEVRIPFQIYEGAKFSEICENWSVEYWKRAFRTLPLEFAVKDHASTRYMTRRVPNVDARMYANYFWKKFACMSEWKIVTPEISTPRCLVAEKKVEALVAAVDENDKEMEGNARVDLQEVYKLMGMKFAAL